MRLPGDWTVRQVVLGAVLLALFVAVAAVVPVLIQPGTDPEPSAGEASPTLSAPPSSAAPTPSAEASPTPTATPAPKKSTPSFVVRPAVEPRPVKDPPHAMYKEFPSVCAQVRSAAKAPVAGLATDATGYDVFGTTDTKLAAPGKVPSGASSCLNPGDRSTYWVPQLTQAGEAIEPETFQVLYKGAVDDYTSVQAFPAGLRILAGGRGAAPSAAAESSVSFSCTDYDENALPPASTCRDGDRLIARIAAPGCWDGRHLDVSGHRSHLAWAASGQCPSSHPVAIPTLLVRVVYPIDAAQGVKVSGLKDAEYGFGAVAGWQPKVLRQLVGECINAGEHCGETGRPN
ncbi:hypothetical protein GCM10027456_36420 [Kineosporia babensis]